MKTSAIFEITISGGRITNAQVMSDGTCKIEVELKTDAQASLDNLKNIFVKVPVSELRLDDTFMQHVPKTKNERAFRVMVEEAIQKGLKDFWRPKYDPSFTDRNKGIYYRKGQEPALEQTYMWWEETAKKYAPENGSRLGTTHEYIAFLAVLIKELVASGKSVEWAWNAVCNDSKELGHYFNTNKDGLHTPELTGSRKICDWYDLANTNKILAEDTESGEVYVAGGSFFFESYIYPLSTLSSSMWTATGTGWVVLTEVNYDD